MSNEHNVILKSSLVKAAKDAINKAKEGTPFYQDAEYDKALMTIAGYCIHKFNKKYPDRPRLKGLRLEYNSDTDNQGNIILTFMPGSDAEREYKKE